MATEETRNFRSSYYEKVGFRSVEEKKSIEILLKEKPLDISKLKQFSLRFTVPQTYRPLMWKLLLGIISPHVESHTFIMDQRTQEYNDLLEALQSMHIVSEDLPKHHIFLIMWLLRTGNLKLDWRSQLEDPPYQNLLLISSALLEMFDNDVDIFWISKGFFQYVNRFYASVHVLVNTTLKSLEKEDQELYSHLEKVQALDAIPFTKWYCSCFAGLLKDLALAKIWDKLVGGSCKILVFVAIRILTTMKRRLIQLKSAAKIVDCLCDITEETAEMIANKAIELWQQYGSPLTPASHPDGLKPHPPNLRLKGFSVFLN
ncbi:hypothetical protein ONE63_005663 [Megalurothrips usitatus]|uniref:TBC1 domain family member 7 n=1 Tax=Megalurothrips usitatus TaxID=439358 RepID=A0AAV7Y065_9NEOP|nr:hypothetical protein ONE63_005663 [Megalurothrips usitatus]